MDLKMKYINPVCEICNERIGRGFNHAECSIIKKEIYGDSSEKNNKKKLSKKDTDKLYKIVSRYD